MTAERAERAIAALYETPLPIDAGVVHVAAVWEAPDRTYRNMRIVPETPASPTDAFVLALARARADAIVTTGRILRAEPDLDYALAPAQEARDRDRADLVAWRRDCMGRTKPPWVVVLTRGGDLDLAHPAFAPGRSLVLTGRASASALSAQARERGIEVVGRDEPGPIDALDHLRNERGCATVLVEAGPSTSSALYAPPGRVDELLLSICHAPSLAPGVPGDAFPPGTALERAGLGCVSRRQREEPSGPWTFTRFVRR